MNVKVNTYYRKRTIKKSQAKKGPDFLKKS